MRSKNYSISEIYNMNSIPYSGKDIGVAILDTGIYPHNDFSNRIIVFKDFVNHKITAYDDNSHGTHVAGIIGGNGYASKGTIKGIAPGCKIFALKILDRRGNGNKQALILACEWIKRNYKKYNIRIINISIGSETSDCEEEKNEVSDLINELWDCGIALVVSAGNSGPGPGTITFPGTCEKVITVGSDAVALKNGPEATSHSGEGPTKCNIRKPDLIAPGTNIISCHNKYNGYTVKSGTSMSTPVVSGSIALYLEKNPASSNELVKLCILKSATDLGLSYNRQGAGLLNIQNFLKTTLR